VVRFFALLAAIAEFGNWSVPVWISKEAGADIRLPDDDQITPHEMLRTILSDRSYLNHSCRCQFNNSYPMITCRLAFGRSFGCPAL
jgi:hypothetical protein